MRKKLVIPAVLLVLLVALLAAGCAGAGKGPEQKGGISPGGTPAPAVGTAVGQQAPDFTLQTADGKSVSLSSLRGRPVLLNFWATWCPPCQAEMPEIEKFYRQNNKKFNLVAVNLTSSEKSVEQVNKFLQAGGYTFPVLLDKEGAVAGRYAVRYIPTSFFIDARGVIQMEYTGPMSLQIMQDGLNKAGR